MQRSTAVQVPCEFVHGGREQSLHVGPGVACTGARSRHNDATTSTQGHGGGGEVSAPSACDVSRAVLRWVLTRDKSAVWCQAQGLRNLHLRHRPGLVLFVGHHEQREALGVV
jgi:hypothetical protein